MKKMACQAMHMWSLSGLVAAFVDLSIAYLLLCGSSIAFLASKFLGFFGLYLPCPCDGLFLNIPSKEYCLSRLLVDFPTQKVSSVHLSVKHKFPFNDSVWGRTHSYGVLENDYVNRIPQIEGEGSCSSVSDVKMSRSVVLKELSDRDEKYDLKGKRDSDHRPRSRLRQNRKGGGGRGKYSSVSSYDSSVNGDNEKASTVLGVSQRSLSSIETNLCPDEDMHIKHVMSNEELQDQQHGIQNFSGDEKNKIKLLEQELEEERIARAALYIELEKERSAAATAADEAMAMILRLQEEKASIGMEARQYQRIIDEKSAYDAEEMNILKEILVRREMEKHFLEKEVEAYRQMVSLGNEQLGGDNSDTSDTGRLFGLMLDPNDDPIVMLHQLNASNEKKVITETSSDGVGNLQEKEMISADNNSYLTPNVPEQCEFLENTTPVEEKKVEQIEKTNGDHELSEKIIVTCNGTETSSNYGSNLEQQISSNNSCHGMFDKDSHVHDVHVIGDQTDLYRSSSDITCGLPPMGPKGKSLLSDLRRSSMSAVDSEMLKIDCEVGKLRERLKIVQEGREKLSFSVESRERENMQLKLLEDISRQVQEIRDLTEPGRQASLPLTNSKVLSKRRRCRSVSSGPQRNSRG